MKFVGNCNIIEWHKLIQEVQQHDGKILTYTPSGNDLDNQWQAAGYKHNDPAIEWIQYWSGKTFDQTIADQFGKWVGATPYYTFISRIRVGKFIPFHVDHMKDQDNIPGTPVRYTCFMSGPINGHLSLVEDQVVHHAEVGDVWEWPSPSSTHSGINVSDTDKWQFNFWGYK
jgi:hypothetical protein